MGIKTHHKLSNILPEQWKGKQAVTIAERLMKCALKFNSDSYRTLLHFRNTPTSPALRFINRRRPTLLPTKESLLVPRDLEKEQKEKHVKLKERQAHYNTSRAKDLEQLTIRDPVRIAPPNGMGPSNE